VEGFKVSKLTVYLPPMTNPEHRVRVNRAVARAVVWEPDYSGWDYEIETDPDCDSVWVDDTRYAGVGLLAELREIFLQE
jgi:hypothetical protein